MRLRPLNWRVGMNTNTNMTMRAAIAAIQMRVPAKAITTTSAGELSRDALGIALIDMHGGGDHQSAVAQREKDADITKAGPQGHDDPTDVADKARKERLLRPAEDVLDRRNWIEAVHQTALVSFKGQWNYEQKTEMSGDGKEACEREPAPERQEEPTAISIRSGSEEERNEREHAAVDQGGEQHAPECGDQVQPRPASQIEARGRNFGSSLAQPISGRKGPADQSHRAYHRDQRD